MAGQAGQGRQWTVLPACYVCMALKFLLFSFSFSLPFSTFDMAVWYAFPALRIASQDLTSKTNQFGTGMVWDISPLSLSLSPSVTFP